tara:strand:+ start:6986 stop:7648 length:663 start_codon:yes stop_codon:yes gene_type:complete
MSSNSTPYGLIPKQKLGFGYFNGAFREYPVKANNSAAIFNGDLVVLSTAGLPSAVSSTPTAIKIPATAADATAGIMGVCVGCRYIDSNGVTQFDNFLPANLVTGGATEVFVRVADDPDLIFQVKGTAALGTFNSGTDGSGFAGAVGMNAALDFNTSGSTANGKSGVALAVGSNGGSLAATSTLAVRIVEVVPDTEADDYPEFFVKLNVGVHSYHNSLGLA